MATSAFLCFDVGTTNLKGAVVSATGALLARHVVRLRDEPGLSRAESVQRRLAEAGTALLTTGELRDSIAGVALATQMAGLVLLARAGAPLLDFVPGATPATPGALDRVRQLERAAGIDLHDRTGCPISPTYPLPKLLAWAADRPDQTGNVRYAGGRKELLRLALTGEWLTDTASASTLQLLDQHTGHWLAPATAHLPWLEGALPAVRVPWEVAGTLRDEWRDRWGLGRSTPVIVGTGDGLAAHLASGAIHQGHLSVSIGTTIVVRWFESAPRPLPPDQFRQMVTAQCFLRGMRIVRQAGATRERELAARLADAVRRAESEGGPRRVAVTGGGAGAWLPLLDRRFAAPVERSAWSDATGGVAALALMALEGMSLEDAVQRIAPSTGNR
jgi:sugar (pentulose or hexulose) kinase